MTFKELNINNNNILKALEKNSFSTPTEIQQRAIPVFLDNKNLFGKSSTGTGKTASFVLPILQNIEPLKSQQVLIMTPTRELALQIVDQVRMFSSFMEGVSVAPVIGGARMDDQVRRIKKSEIIVGTPGRINDHINRNTFKPERLTTIILDEADEMLKMGFKNEIDAVFEKAKDDVLIGLYSATVNDKVLSIANNYLKEYEYIEIDNQIKVNKNIKNEYIITKGYDKQDVLMSLLDERKNKKMIIFSNTKSNTDKLFKLLKNKYRVDVINGDKKQSQRTRILKRFRNNELDIVIATDVMARGIDVDGINFVINYDVPIDDEYFVHRIGRTGRNESTGETITFVNSQNILKQLKQIIQTYGLEITELSILDFNLEKQEQGSRSNDRNRSNRRSGNDRNDRNRRSSGNRNDRNRSENRRDRNRSENRSENPRSRDENRNKDFGSNDRNRSSNNRNRRSDSSKSTRDFESNKFGKKRSPKKFDKSKNYSKRNND